MRRRTSIGLFLGAFAVRMSYLAGIRRLMWFPVPLVDGANYFGLARTVAAGHLLGGSEAFWQPPLYPYFLAVLLRIVGERMLPFVTVQAAVGALTCVLVAGIGARLWGSRAGTVAGVLAALYGPLVHFDAQPLVPVVHVFLVTAGLWALVRAEEDRSFAVAGLFWGLAAIATPNILLCAPAAAFWIAWTGRSAAGAGRPNEARSRRGAGVLRRETFWL